MFFTSDPFHLLVMLIGIPLVFIPQWWVKRSFEKVSQMPTQRRMTGQAVAQAMLEKAGIHNVSVEETPHFLGDHYSPQERVVRLSPEVFAGTSIASVAISAHEVGHAMQHAQNYYPVVLRGQMFPLVNVGSQLGPMLLMGSFILMAMGGISELTLNVAWGGVILFSLAVAFHIVTLPVEIDASMRALRVLKNDFFLSSEELPHAKKVLTSAAFTYIATALYALLELLSYVLRLWALSGSQERE